MESKILFGTIMGFQTKDAKGGALVIKVEIPLTATNAAYLVDIKGKNCKMDIHPEEGQLEIEEDGDQNVLDFPESGKSELIKADSPEVDLEDNETMEDAEEGDEYPEEEEPEPFEDELEEDGELQTM